MKLFKNHRGSTAVEFALVALPVLYLTLGIMQTAWIAWVDNMLHYSVDIAARCGGVGSTISPCSGSGTANMIATAEQVFFMGGNPFTVNASCGGSGLVGTYTLNFLLIVNVTVTAKSCYPAV
jgi:hypothetical protein